MLDATGESGSTVYADEGTAAHALLEKCLRQDLEPWRFKGGVIKAADEGVSFHNHNAELGNRCFKIDDDMIDAVAEGYEYTKQRLRDLSGADLHVEQYSRMFDHRHDVGGTADIVIDQMYGMLEVADYKHGRGILVDAEDNSQLLMYLYGIAQASDFMHEEYRYTIIQPRHPRYSGPIWTLSLIHI